MDTSPHPSPRLTIPRGRAIATGLALLSLLALLALAAPAAHAEVSNPFQGVTPEPETEEPAAPAESGLATENAGSEQTGSSSSTLLIAGGIALVLVLGVAFVIVRDARSAAPAKEHFTEEDLSSHQRAVMLRKRRAKAKRARQQRKRNRAGSR